MNRTKLLAYVGLALAAVTTASAAHAQAFTYDPPGTLVPARSGRGRVDAKIYAPTMRFPMEQPRAFANSSMRRSTKGSALRGIVPSMQR